MRDFTQAPFLVIWEITQACDLACRHCRASAQPLRDPRELTTAEAFDVIEQVKGFGDPLLVFTGGDPLKRPDIYTIVRRSVERGLRTTITPSATPLLTPDAIAKLQNCGISRMGLSIDGWDEASHDAFRGVSGSYTMTLRALACAQQLSLETRVNTTVTRHNRRELARIAELVERYGARLWSVFFLVVTGRAAVEDDLTAEEYEQVFDFLWHTAQRGAFDIKTTEAQHYRRYIAQHGRAGSRPPISINDGKGLVFISHTGEVFPSGFLPLSGGNVRTTGLAEAYRNSSLFRVLRDADALEGKCGDCEYRKLCGGSRSRAYALTGSPVAADPRCAYVPDTCRSLTVAAR